MDPAVSWGTLGTHVVAETNRARGAVCLRVGRSERRRIRVRR